MKKVLVSLSAIAVIGTMAAAGTGAFFSDTETSTGNTFAAATLDLALGGATLPFTVSDLVPGQTGSESIVLTNSGSIDGFVDIAATSLVNNENGCSDPETDVDNTCDDPGLGMGELPDNLDFQIFHDVNTNGIFDSGTDVELFNNSLTNLGPIATDLALPFGALNSKTIVFTYSVDPGVGNEIQTDSAAFDLAFELGQTAGQ